MQAIVISYLPATNRDGRRLKARSLAGSVSIPYPHWVNASNIGRIAAEALCEKFDWDSSKLVEGVLPNGDLVFVFHS